ncbi:MAG: UvrD-helicase domain-containing protein [Flavobacteriales bacterium]|nr:UvrD-helicase domain-containing protein [Flavobacteriales bacterium]
MEKEEQPIFKILRASAGSGKTFALVKHYLTCCLREKDPNYFKHILAITFTNKAADEMKHRVLSALRELSAGKGKMMAVLVEETKLTESQITERSAKVFEAMMTGYGAISILTIDKFINRLVRSFAFDLNLDADFRIELKIDRIVESGVDRLLSKIGIDQALTEVVEAFVLQHVEDEHNVSLRDHLITFGKLGFQENYHILTEQLSEFNAQEFLELYREFSAEYAQTVKRVSDLGEEAAEIIDVANLSSAFSRGSVPKFFSGIANGRLDEPTATVVKAFQEGIFTKKTESPDIVARVDAIAPALTDLFTEICNVLTSPEMAIVKLKKGIAKNMFPMAVLTAIDENIKEIQEEGKSRSFSELNRMIEVLVKDNPAPFIFERIGERFHHFLIDEFQDTSVMQWRNFLPLIDHALARGKFNLVVGDGKQAIYRWRNGDVLQLQKLPHLIGELNEIEREREQSLIRAAERAQLTENYRSAKEVVHFNNELFTQLPEFIPPDLKGIYDGAAQHPKGTEGGWVTNVRIPSTEIEQVHEQILAHIKANVALDYRLNDIAILVRRNKEGVEIAEFLLGKGIPAITEESLQLGGHPAVMAVIYLMKSIEGGVKDERSAVQFMQNLSAIRPDIVNLGDDLVKYTTLPDDKVYKGHFNLDLFLAERLSSIERRQIGGMPLYDMVDRICKGLGLYDRFEAYSEAMLQLALEYQSTESEGLSGFLRFWDMAGEKRSIKVPDTVEGVKLMTVHKAKGLEFPVVIAYFSRSSGVKSFLKVDLDPEIFTLPMAMVLETDVKDSWAHDQFRAEQARSFIDDLNVCYVACTRAVNHLHIITGEAKTTAPDPESLIGWLSTRLGEMRGIGDFGEVIQKGTPLKAEHDDESFNGIELKSFRSSDPLGRIKVSADKEALFTEKGRLSARQRGTELHRLVAVVRTLSDLENIKSQPIPWQRMSRQEWEKLLVDLEHIVDDLKEMGWFEASNVLMVERELVLASGKVKRPDRVLITDEVHVLDFKTGAPEEKHKKQLGEYANVLHVLENKPVKAWVYYTDIRELREV